MTTFVIDAQVAIDLARGGVAIPPQHSLAEPTLLRSQALVSGGCESDSSATDHCKTTHGGSAQPLSGIEDRTLRAPITPSCPPSHDVQPLSGLTARFMRSP